MTKRNALWLLIASSMMLGGCVAAVMGGSGTVGAGTTSTRAAVDSDARLTAAVQARLAADAQLRGTTIGVTTRSSVVTLSGAVRSAALRATAERDARAVDGVRSVTNTVTVK